MVKRGSAADWRGNVSGGHRKIGRLSPDNLYTHHVNVGCFFQLWVGHRASNHPLLVSHCPAAGHNEKGNLHYIAQTFVCLRGSSGGAATHFQA